MRLVRTSFLATTILASSATFAQADVEVIASIKPVHSLVAAVMEGVGKPSLLVEGAGSPHTYSLKPSQAKKLQEADLVFWMSHDLEAFLEKSIEGIATNAKSVPLMESHGLIKLNFREGGAFDEHGHDEHEDFHFHRRYQGLEVIAEAGTEIAVDGDRPVVTPFDNCVLVMPNQRLWPGQTAVRLGRIIS